MKKIMRSFLCIIAVIVIFLQSMILVNSITIPNPIKDTYVYDMDNIIDDEVEQNLNVLLKNLNEKTTDEVVVISLKSLEEITIEEYANELFNTLGIGQKGKDNGALLIFSRTDKKVRLEIGRGFEGILNDSKCGRILDEYFVPNRENDNYNSATDQTTKAIVSVILKDAGVELEDFDSKEYETNDKLSVSMFIIVFLIIIGIAILLAFIDSSSSSGGYYSSGGGFSGGSSGSFSSGGGFGGGFSSGGGATR